MENIFQKIKRFNETIDREIEYELNFFQKVYIFLDFVNEYLFHKTMLLDYTQYRFYDKKRKDRRKYVVFGRLLEMMSICNNNEFRYIFDNKIEFNKVFSKYISRDWINFDNTTLEDFERFINCNEEFFVKDPSGMFGLGVKKIQSDQLNNIEDTYKKFKEKKLLCEQPITQCKEMEEFNKSTVNTIRVVSMVDRNKQPHIIGGLLRVGRSGRFADNFHHQGIAAYIDPKYGIVSTKGFDKNKEWHVVHPDSNKKIVGFEVPCWDQIVDTIYNAALEVPEMRYIGWDVAITSDYKIELIEGNSGADPDAEQITTHEGRWKYYKKYF